MPRARQGHERVQMDMCAYQVIVTHIGGQHRLVCQVVASKLLTFSCLC